MSITKEQILDAVAEMSVMDVVELISMMEEKFG
ncbi:50S ribosomal protein L7/L12, partial [Enterobacter hormaechei]|nr:50S ribosomal protein L7/L12 [Enterobacter hormaechei]